MFGLLLSPFLLFLFPLCILFPLSFLQLVWVREWALGFHLERQLLQSHIVLGLSLLKLLDFLVPLHLVLHGLFLRLPEVFTGLAWIARHLLLEVWLCSWKTGLLVARESGLVVERTTRPVQSRGWQLRAVGIHVVVFKDLLINVRVHGSSHGFERAKWSWDIMFCLVNHGRLELVGLVVVRSIVSVVVVPVPKMVSVAIFVVIVVVSPRSVVVTKVVLIVGVAVVVAIKVVIHICWVSGVAVLRTLVVKILGTVVVAVHWVHIHVGMVEPVVSIEAIIRVHLLFKQSCNTQTLVSRGHS